MSKKTTFEELPEEILKDLHFLIRSGKSAASIKTALEKKFTDTMPKISKATYHRYIAENKDRLIKEYEMEKELGQTAKDSLDALQDVQNAIASGSNDSVKAQLDSLHKFCAKRIDFIMEQQSRFASPQYENASVQYVKLLQVILDKTIQYRAEVEGQKHEQFRDILLTIVEKVGTRVRMIYEELHGKDKLEDLIMGLDEKFMDVVDEALMEHGFDVDEIKKKAKEQDEAE